MVRVVLLDDADKSFAGDRINALALRVVIDIVARCPHRHPRKVLSGVGIKHHYERRSPSKIADIKDHEFKTMAEYVAAYAQVEPLLTEYDQKLQEYSELYNTAQERDQKRGLINIQRLHNRNNPEIWRNTSELIALIRQINDVMKKEASVIRDMGSLPEQEQVQFWHEEFMPLVAQEHALRERLLVAGQNVSQERSTQ